MKRLADDIINFFQSQGYVIVSTIDKNGSLHNACKGIVDIKSNGRIYLLDLYKGKTFQNLKNNRHISISAVDEHKFIGYCLKGKARIITGEEINPQIIKSWEERITSRLTRRVIRNIHEEKGHPRHPEALLPKPEYLIVMDAEEVIDLTPHHLK
jgi:predicted pyridoxine 5'-phosphate oxidase superfamily flavin-nucleotide-binding protein